MIGKIYVDLLEDALYAENIDMDELRGILDAAKESITGLRAELAVIEVCTCSLRADIFWREKLAIKFCEARGIPERSEKRASIVDAFISGLAYAAPVAKPQGVVMPERCKEDANSNLEWSDGWNECLKEVARLNGQ